MVVTDSDVGDACKTLKALIYVSITSGGDGDEERW